MATATTSRRRSLYRSRQSGGSRPPPPPSLSLSRSWRNGSKGGDGDHALSPSLVVRRWPHVRSAPPLMMTISDLLFRIRLLQKDVGLVLAA
ncbi:hypothetical protein LINGRAHAP2_LOCUS31240 [Linum grandiflorum]